jgi:hypothetical protein
MSTQWNSLEGSKSTEFKSKNVTDTSVKYILASHADPYVYFSTNNSNIDLGTYNHMVIYYRSDSAFKFGVTGDTNCNRYTVASTDGEWVAHIVDLQETEALGSIRIDFAENTGNDVYVEINSVAFFETLEEAQTFAGIGLN